MSKIYVAKQDPRIPDYYEVTFTPMVGETQVFKVVSHSFIPEMRALEFVLFEDEMLLIPLDAGTFKFDKKFMNLLELRKEQTAKQPTTAVP